MIHLFDSGIKILFFPKKWGNSIVRWIAGVHSPTGTIKVKNTMSPRDDGSLALDVNIDAVSEELLERMENRALTRQECNRISQHIRGIVDGSSIIMGGGHISVDGNWVDNRIKEFMQSSADGPTSEYVTHDKLTDTLEYYATVESLSDYAEAVHEHTTDNLTDWATATAHFLTDADLSDYITTSNIGVSGGVAAFSHTHNGYAATLHSHGNINADGTLNGCLAADCLLITTTGGLITHSNSNPKASDIASLVSQWIKNGKTIGSSFSTSATGFAYNTSGTISYKAFGSSAGTVAEGNHNHDSDYAAIDHDHNSDYASISTVNDLTDTVESIQTEYQDASDVSSAITAALADYVSATDLGTMLADYVTHSDLGEYLGESDFPSGFLGAAASGASASFTFVSDVSWNGTELQKRTRTVTVTNGLITSIGNNSAATSFATAVTYNAT